MTKTFHCIMKKISLLQMNLTKESRAGNVEYIKNTVHNLSPLIADNKL